MFQSYSFVDPLEKRCYRIINKITGKHLCSSLFLSNVYKQTFTDVLQSNCFLKVCKFCRNTCVGVFFNKLQNRFSPAKFAKFLETPCFADYLQRLLLPVSGFQPATLLKRRLRQRCFSVNFEEFSGTSFDRAPPNDCFLCLSEKFEKFFRIPLS